MTTITKLRTRTEWQAFLVGVVVMFLNRFLELGLTEGDIWAMFTGSGAYAVGRGLAKREPGGPPSTLEFGPISTVHTDAGIPDHQDEVPTNPTEVEP